MRFRLQFSVRTLAIVVTLVCAYFGAWEATKRYGMGPVQKHLNETYLSAYARAIGPCLFTVEPGAASTFGPPPPDPPQYYYVWLFGPTLKLEVVREPTLGAARVYREPSLFDTKLMWSALISLGLVFLIYLAFVVWRPNRLLNN